MVIFTFTKRSHRFIIRISCIEKYPLPLLKIRNAMEKGRQFLLQIFETSKSTFQTLPTDQKVRQLFPQDLCHVKMRKAQLYFQICKAVSLRNQYSHFEIAFRHRNETNQITVRMPYRPFMR